MQAATRAVRRLLLAAATALAVTAAARAAGGAPAAPPAWIRAHEAGPLSAEETRDFMRRLARYVFDHHLKQDPKSAQRGMIYEYVDTRSLGRVGQWVQGEALDTMHDGAWFAAACVNAFRATGDPFYREFLSGWTLPFYVKMLNRSDALFSARRNDAAPDAHVFPKTHYLIDGEKGFVPYWWDDGASVSLERREKKQALGAFACVDNLAGRPNPEYLLDGHSLGCSNHMAQDLAVMLQLAWLLLRDSGAPAEKALAAGLAEAARNLHESRLRHHGPIPMVMSAAALACGDADLMKRLPGDLADWTLKNHYTAALHDAPPGQKRGLPAFADDQQYRYYYNLAKAAGRPTPALAFRVVYDAFTEPMLWRYFCDAAPPPPGINRGEYGHDMVDGAFPYHQSDRQGVRFLGSRMGPQNMVMAGIALQLLRTHPGLWEERYKQTAAGDWRVPILDPAPGATAERTPAEPVALGPARVNLASTRSGLMICGLVEGKDRILGLAVGAVGKAGRALLTVKEGEPVRAVNDRGETLLVQAEVKADADRLGFDLFLPYTVTKGQKAWANGIEHGRYAIEAGGETRTFTLASPEAQVKAWLERELGCGLRTWDALFRHYGYIPTHIGRNAFWDGLSDSGGYAHLLSAGAQWLLYLEGKNDWEVQGVAKAGG